MVNHFSLRIVWENPSLILSGNNFLSDFTYLAAELWITEPPSFKKLRVNTKNIHIDDVNNKKINYVLF
jgi:hypothetical protein